MSLLSPITGEQVKTLLSDHNGYRQLILIITENCNLRCKYCAYSGHYFNMRPHQERSMTTDIAKKAIEMYFQGFIESKAKNPYLIPTISFYGGEPLLNFNLIRNTVIIARRRYRGKILFTITTNGTVLTNEVMDFLYENDFVVSISLNGPSSEHDRTRVFPNGEGSFQTVWGNLQKLRSRYPSYYKRNCNLLVCYDVATNLEEMENFFETYRNDLPPIARVSLISPYFTDWYDQYSDDQKTIFRNSLQKSKQRFVDQLIRGNRPSSFLQALIGTQYFPILLRSQNAQARLDCLPYTSTCIPGTKIAVDPQGRLHTCERINEWFPIGDVRRGLDYEKIADLINLYRREIYPECINCPVTRVCTICYAAVAGNGYFERNPPDLCFRIRQSIKNKFAELWTMFELGITETQILGPQRPKEFCDACEI